ncbi:MAG TPA: PQQ-dependent sugar dehydrogenase [Gemmatimonadota bacterium]|nr:PQQ-dependent sugar dehydrogenase [Gemmatimonadota bacterium]
MIMPHRALTPFVVALVAACADANGGSQPPPPSGDTAPALETVATGLDFPLHVTAPPGDPRVFVVEKAGRIRIVEGGALLPEPFLDVSGEVSGGSEQGLLSLAFHPGYAANGRFFVNYTDRGGDTRVVEYRVSADPNRADPAPVRTVLTVAQPFSNHNGGLVAFGPDGMLYVGMGDGGSGGDPQGNAQDLGTLLGKLLRIDVDGGAPYAVPADNPFTGEPGARGEIWAYGLRNPWRFAFDRETGDLYVADVGQNRLEEVNAVEGTGRGLDYGWNVMEGDECVQPREGCDTAGRTLPVVVYGHGDGCSVTGGHVYRGSAIPDLQGAYFYSDFCSGFVRSFRFAGGAATDEQSWPELRPSEGSVSSFGEDAAGEIYLMTSGGTVYKFVPR